MARRFGGKFSPGLADPGSPAAMGVDPVGTRANLMLLPPFVMAVASLAKGPEALLAGLGGAALMAAGALLLRQGLRAEAAYDARTSARPPALPRKTIAALLAGGGIALAAWVGPSGVTGALSYGVSVVALHLLAFGADPFRTKRKAGVDAFQQDRVARVVDEAEAYLTAIRSRVAALNDRLLLTHIDALVTGARRMIAAVENDPSDLNAARRYLGVYLMGARDATDRFADLYATSRDADARAAYEALLVDLDGSFARQTEKMRANDRAAMDIEIKVLNERLKIEGLNPMEDKTR